MLKMRFSLFRWLAALGYLAALLLTADLAVAVGRVQWKSTTLDEKDNKSWQVEVTIYLPKPPNTAHMPVKFEFEPTVYYERSMVDGKDDPVMRNVPLVGRQALIESVDIGFMDPGTGKIEKRTRFSFKVTRGHGYEAGEYKVTIRDGRTGATIGTPTTLKFKGENEIIDRRSIVFTGESKKKKKEEDKSEGEPSAEETSAPAAAEETPTDEAEDPFANEPGDEPEEVEKKSGGCGCRLSDSGSNGSALAALALVLFAAYTRRRR